MLIPRALEIIRVRDTTFRKYPSLDYVGLNFGQMEFLLCMAVTLL